MPPPLTAERWIDPLIDGISIVRHPDRVIAELAALQHGVVASWQLVGLGLRPWLLEKRLTSGHLHAAHDGVYAVGHARLTPDGRRMAAVLAGGTGALLSHVSALGLRGLVEREPSRLHVTVPVDVAHVRPSLRFHRATLLAERDVSVVRGVPCTSWALSLVDFAASRTSTPQTIEQACDVSARNGVFDSRLLDELFGRMRGRRGMGKLKAVLAARGRFATDLRSRLEVEAWEWIATLPVPTPRANERLALGATLLTPDLFWPEPGLVLELDSRAWHGDLAAIRADEERDRLYRDAGLRVERMTWWDVTRDRGRSEARLLHHF